MNLARSFKAGRQRRTITTCVALADAMTRSLNFAFVHAVATRRNRFGIPALQGRAKFIPTLRVEDQKKVMFNPPFNIFTRVRFDV
jgi:hypothetical protein